MAAGSTGMTRVAFSLVHALRFILDRLYYALTRPSWLSEVASGLGTFVWGVLALRVTDQHIYWPSMDVFVRVSPSPVWGSIAIVFGIGQMFAFAALDRHWRRPWLRWGSAFVVAWLWGAMCISAATQEEVPIPPVVGGLLIPWFINVYLICRIIPTNKAGEWLHG